MKYSILHSLCLVVLFLLVCSMTRCGLEDVTPQAETVIQGTIKDPRTGEPVPNIKIVINKSWKTGLHTSDSKSYDSLYTRADGSYYLKFIPIGSGDYSLRINDYKTKYFIYSVNSTIQLGKINTLNYGFQKAIKLTVKLKNTSSQNRTKFRLFTDTCCLSYSYNRSYGYSDFSPVIKDTTFNYYVPYLSSVKLTSLYGNYGINNLTDTLSFKKIINMGKADTTINLLNP